MRENIFRGKRKDNGVFIEGDLIQISEGRKFIIDNKFGACIDDKGNFINTEAPFVCEVDPETVGQYTGSTDICHKKIFKGILFKRFLHDMKRNIYIQSNIETEHFGSTTGIGSSFLIDFSFPKSSAIYTITQS